MLKTALLIALSLVVAVAGGGLSVWYALDAQEGVGAVRIGGWTTYPDIGTPDSNPYAKARIAREGTLALGRAEGLTFIAQRDSNGEALRRECQYTLEGSVPAARLWTLFAEDAAGWPVAAEGGGVLALTSYNLVFLPDNSLALAVGPRAAPGNWLRLNGSGPMTLVLTLYDTPLAGSTELADIELPQVLKAGCDA